MNLSKLTDNKLTNNKITRSKSFRQLVKYGIVGVIGLGIDMGVYYLLVFYFSVHYPLTETLSELLGGRMSVNMLNILMSNVISTTLAVINNFILNSYFTFRVTNNRLKRFFQFAGVALIGLAISSTLLTLFIGILNMNEMVAKAVSVLIVAMLQFVINKFFTFKSK